MGTSSERWTGRLAIASDGDQVAAHFGRCEGYTIVTVVNGVVERQQTIANPGHEPGYLPGYLAQRGVTCIVAGGMGPRAQGLFDQQGIATIVGVEGGIADAVAAMLAGALQGGDSTCEH